MAYTDITSQLISQNYASTSVGSFYRSSVNAAYGFVASAYNGTTYLASDNLGVANSAANLLLSIQSVTSPINVKFTYYIHSEASYDYGIFGNSGSSITSSATYSNGTVYASTYGSTYSASPNTVIYYITGNTNINVFYKKDSSVNKGWDRMLMTIAVRQASGGGGTPSDTPYFWCGARFMLNGYRNNINRTYMISSSLRSQTKIALSNSLVNLDDTVSPTQMVASGVPGTYFWMSGQSASFADLSPTSPYTMSLPINLSADTIGHTNLGTHTVTMTVITGMTAASVMTNITGTLTATPFTTLTVQQLTWAVTVTGKNGSTSNSKAYFEISFGNPINQTYVTGKLGYVKLRTSAITCNSSVSVTANRNGSASSTGTLGANTSLTFGPTSASSTEPLAIVEYLAEFDSGLAVLEFGSEMKKQAVYDNSSHFDSRLGATNRLMHKHDFLSFTGTPDYFKDETQESESYTTSFNWDADSPSDVQIQITSWDGQSGNWTASTTVTGTTLPITGITTGYQTTLNVAAFDVIAGGMGSQQQYEDWVVSITLEFLNSSNTVLKSVAYGYITKNDGDVEMGERAIAFNINEKPAKVRPIYYFDITSTASSPGGGNKCWVEISEIYGTGVTTIQT